MKAIFNGETIAESNETIVIEGYVAPDAEKPAGRQRGARDDQQHDRDLDRHLSLLERSAGAADTDPRRAGQKRGQAEHRRRRRRHAPVSAVARAAHLRQAALSRAVAVVWLPVQAVHHFWPARPHWLSGCGFGALDAAPHVALHPALHRAVGVQPVCAGARHRL